MRAEDVRQMLGLADRVRVVDLFEALMKGDVAAALNELREQYDIGADPGVILSDLAEFTHFVTRVKVVPSVADDVSLSEAERVRGRAFATQLSMRVLSRTWQMLLKGVERGAGLGPPGRRRRNGAGAHCLCRRSADAGRSGALARRERCSDRRVPSSNGGGGFGFARRAPQSFAPRYDAPRGVAALAGRRIAAPGRRSGGAARRSRRPPRRR